jgi:hypothetical protein
LLSNLNILTKSIGRATGLALLFLSLNLKAQNLVYNPSFEEHDECPSVTNYNFNACIGWFNPTNALDHSNVEYFSTPDYFNSCYSSIDLVLSVPKNGFGSQQAHTGNAYVGIIAGLAFASNPPDGAEYREYIEGQLTSPLVAGKTYCVGFYLSLACRLCNYSLDKIGAHFSADSLLASTQFNIQVIPQVENQSNNFLSDSTGWMKFAGAFIANGGERFITIGNFRNQANTSYNNLNYFPSYPDWTQVYYYIDDVSVTECEVGIEETPTPPTYLYPNPTTNTVTLSYTFKQATTIEVYSINGACLLKQPIQAGTQNPIVDVSNLANGLYVVRAYTTTQPLFNQRLAIVK